MSEKITKATSRAIASEVVKIKHQPIIDAAQKAWIEASDIAYDFVFDDEEAKIAETLSDKWVSRNNYFYIRTDVNGRIQALLSKSRVVPGAYQNQYSSNPKIFAASEPKIKAVIDAKESFDEAKAKADAARDKLSNIIYGRSPNALIKDWPEIKPYLEKRNICIPNTNLVVSAEKLNDEYGLPDPNEAVAA